jgi:hypothetical protein
LMNAPYDNQKPWGCKQFFTAAAGAGACAVISAPCFSPAAVACQTFLREPAFRIFFFKIQQLRRRFPGHSRFCV